MKTKTYQPTPFDALHKARLARFVIPGVSSDDCWGWRGSAIKNGGHGRIRINNIEYVASRLSYAVHACEDPGNLDVCHSCDNPICTNPKHLFLGTHTQNMRDASVKGRFSLKSRRASFAGEAHPGSKLTDIQVAEVRSLYRDTTRTQKEIARQFGVSQSMISDIVGGRRRKEPLGERIAWAPMGAAPRDGTRVLLWCGRPVCGRYTSAASAQDGEAAGWVTDASWPDMSPPEAWMPIPPIPSHVNLCSQVRRTGKP